MAFIKRPTHEQLKQQLKRGSAQQAVGAKAPAVVQDDTQTIETWFMRLHLFYGIPFNYVVPDARMLPIESLRFFQVDNNWMEVLIDGAFSIGASKAPDKDSLMQSNIMAVRHSAKQKRGSVRQLILRKAKGPAAEKAKQQLAAGAPDAPGPVSGFFLRSMVVTGWPGMQVYGFLDSAGQNPIQILRMELLSPSLLFVLFDGVVASVTLQEPSEGVHFGVTPDTTPPTTELRYAATAGDVTSGQIIPSQETYPVPMRTTSTFNVLRANTFAQQLINQPTVWPPGTNPPYPAFTAAQFALEMVQGVQEVSFNISNS